MVSLATIGVFSTVILLGCVAYAASANITYMMEVCPPYEVDNRYSHQGNSTYAHYNKYLLKEIKYFEMAGTKYTNGFTLHDAGSFALFALNSKYSQIEFTLGHVDGTTMQEMPIQFYVDGNLVKEINIKPESMPQKITLPLNHGLQLKVFTPENPDGHPYIGLGNITIK